MRVKISLLALVVGFGPWVASAQTSDAEAEAVIHLLGVQKKEAIAKLVPVFGRDSAAFWKIYDEYHRGNLATARDRLNLYEGTAIVLPADERRGSPTRWRSCISPTGWNRKKTWRSITTRSRSATNAVVAFEFYQAEVYLADHDQGPDHAADTDLWATPTRARTIMLPRKRNFPYTLPPNFN